MVWIHSTRIFEDNLLNNWVASTVGAAGGVVQMDFSFVFNTHQGMNGVFRNKNKRNT